MMGLRTRGGELKRRSREKLAEGGTERRATASGLKLAQKRKNFLKERRSGGKDSDSDGEDEGYGGHYIKKGDVYGGHYSKKGMVGGGYPPDDGPEQMDGIDMSFDDHRNGSSGDPSKALVPFISEIQVESILAAYQQGIGLDDGNEVYRASMLLFLPPRRKEWCNLYEERRTRLMDLVYQYYRWNRDAVDEAHRLINHACDVIGKACLGEEEYERRRRHRRMQEYWHEYGYGHEYGHEYGHANEDGDEDGDEYRI